MTGDSKINLYEFISGHAWFKKKIQFQLSLKRQVNDVKTSCIF